VNVRIFHKETFIRAEKILNCAEFATMINLLNKTSDTGEHRLRECKTNDFKIQESIGCQRVSYWILGFTGMKRAVPYKDSDRRFTSAPHFHSMINCYGIEVTIVAFVHADW
jgi:hypothetical protein